MNSRPYVVSSVLRTVVRWQTDAARLVRPTSGSKTWRQLCVAAASILLAPSCELSVLQADAAPNSMVEVSSFATARSETPNKTNGRAPTAVAEDPVRLATTNPALLYEQAAATMPPVETRDGNSSRTPGSLALIRLSQLLLSELGYDPGPIDGIEGSRTRAAVLVFQAATGGDGGQKVSKSLVARLIAAKEVGYDGQSLPEPQAISEDATAPTVKGRKAPARPPASGGMKLVKTKETYSSYKRKPVRSLLEGRRENVVIQEWDLSCGAAALATILAYQHDNAVPEKEIATAMLAKTDPMRVQARLGFSLLDLKRFAQQRGYTANGYAELTVEDLIKFGPTIVPVVLNDYRHFVVFRGAIGDRVFLADPAYGNRTMPRHAFEKAWRGRIGFVVARLSGVTSPNRLTVRAGDLVFPNSAVIRPAIG